jgi:hypothetical protein
MKPGLYTIWERQRFLYVGMAGRGVNTRAGLYGRLNSHASGRRSGDQFCIYVCDRLILPQLSRDQLADVGEGRLFLDSMTRAYVSERLGFRFTTTDDGRGASAVEREIKRGGLMELGKPALNPDERPD